MRFYGILGHSMWNLLEPSRDFWKNPVQMTSEVM
jgi:hypothetical protein